MRKIYKKSSISEDIPGFMYEKIKQINRDQLDDFKSLKKVRLVFFYLVVLFVMVFISNISYGQTFTNGNIAVLVNAASASNTTGSIVELNTTTAGQSAINTYSIPSSTTTLSNQLRFSGSATSTGYISNSNDGTLLCFTGANTIDAASNVNAITNRGVGTFNNGGTYNLAATYTGSNGNQTRGASSINNSAWFIGDQGGFYSNGTTSASPTGNIRSVKAFGGTVYAFTSSATLAPVGTISAATGGTYTALPGLAAGATTRQDFYLISSGTNGTSYDVLYVLDATSGTAGTIFKYSLVSGSWTANGTYTTNFGGFGIAAQQFSTGANLFVTTGTGATTANKVNKLFDAAGFNTTINITTANNVTLYTAAAGTIVKGVAFAPITTATASIALSSPSQISSGNLLQGSVDQPISNFQAAVTTANATLNSLSFVTGNGGGSYIASDITNFKLYYNSSSNTFGSAVQIGTTQSGVGSGSTVTFSSLATTINNGSTGYFWITSSVASGAAAGNKFNANANPTLTFASGTQTGSIAAGGNQTITVAVPTISLANGTIATGNITQNTTNNILYRADVTISTTAASLSSASFTTAGTYAASDITNLKLWYQTSTTFNSGTATLLATKTTGLAAGTQLFSSLSQSFSIGTGYLFVTTDVPCAGTAANTINVNAISTGSLTFASGTPTGSSFTAGGSQAIVSATPSNATASSATATGNSGEVALSWTNPAGCFNEIMVVAAPAANTGTPSGDGSSYSASLTYGSGTSLGNGFVVYKGSTSPETITGLTNGTAYSFKLFTRNGTIWSAGVEVSATPILAPAITEVLLPQYMQGLNGTNTNRIPYACLLTITNLTANATYNYFPAVVISSDATTSNGAGNCIFPSSTGFVRSTGGSLSSAGNFGSFTANTSGSYTGWFVIEPTGNATRFIPGNNVFIRLNMNDGAGGTTVVNRPTTTNSVKIINLVAAAGANNGTGLRGNSSATAKNFVVTYDNTAGAGRPISATFVESDGTANTTANSYALFYGTSVEAVSGAYGIIIPNTNSNGIQRIEQRDLVTGNIIGCASTDADGVWPSGANTVNPTGGATAVVITSGDAALSSSTSVGGSVTANASVCYGVNSGTLSLSGQTGSVIKWQYSTDNFVSDINDIANTTTSQSYSNLTQTTYYRAVVQFAPCPAVNSSAAVIIVRPQVGISCPGNITANVTPGICSASVSFAASATGVSPVLTYKIGASAISSPYPFSLGTTTVTATATDSCGASQSCSFNVTVVDNENPTIAAPADVTMNITTGCTASGVVLGSPSTDDNCSIVSVTNDAPANFNIGATTVTWTVTDGSGNISTATQTVTITTTGADFWNGNISSDWFDASNWCAGIPSATTDVQIPAGAANMPLINNSGATCKNININTGATLSISANGNLNVQGDWTNDGSFIATGGAVNFDGTAVQSIFGSPSFYEMDLNNTSGLTLGTSSNITITSLLQLTDGLITTGSNVVTISDTASVNVTNGYVNGNLKKYISLGASISQTFEIGTATTYTPVSLMFNQVNTDGYLTASTVSSDHPSISTSGFNASKTVNRYWNIINSGVAFDYYSADLNFATADRDAGFIDMYAAAKIYTGTWHTTTESSSSANSISITDATVLGAIQIGIINPVPVAISVSPNVGYQGQTLDLVFNGTGFIAGVTSVNAASGVTINSTTVNNDSTLTLNVTIGSAATIGNREFAIKNSLPGGGLSDSLSFTIQGHPLASFYANNTSITCIATGNTQFTNYSTYGTSYYWDFGAGASPATATGFGPYTVTYSTTGLKTVKLVALSPVGNDTLTRTNYINVTSNTPLAPASITGPASVCSYGTSNVLYSTPLVSGITLYTWTVPAGVTIISGQGTRSLIVSFGAAFTSGNISVVEANGCGTSVPRSIAVSRVTVAPATLTGPTTGLCPSGLASATYTCGAVTGATGYTWTAPTGATVTAGQGTSSATISFGATFTTGNISVVATNTCGSSVAKTLTVRSTLLAPATLTGPATGLCPSGVASATYTCGAVAGATGYTWTAPAGATVTAGQGTSIATISFGATFTTGSISVVATNACGSGLAKTLAVRSTLLAPATLTGTTTGLCPSGIASTTYTCAAVTGATSYTWTAPTGATVTAGQGTLSATISFGATFTTGNISVVAANACGSSTAKTLAVRSTLLAPATLTGITTGLCPSGIASTTYTCAAVTGATGYTWTAPSGATVTAGQGTTSATISFGATFTTGSISVVAANACGSSTAKTLALRSTLLAPATLTGITTGLCPSGVASTVYTCAAVTGATAYTWTAPSGATVTAGQGTTSATISFSGTFTTGNISVVATNACGSGLAKTLAVRSLLAAPGVITGSSTVCAHSTGNLYSIAAVTGATSYLWTAPAGAVITGQGTNSISVDFATSAGAITVKAINACGNSPVRSFSTSMNCMGTDANENRSVTT
ncbi:MAG: beta strand repeat-containing protein, partial [Bacteroidia bacterium]